ncbi:MAG: hypothetical protein AB7U62_12815 [Pseudolabrys sp.]
MTALHALMALPFAALLLAAALYVLSLSGHFPAEHRGAALSGVTGNMLMVFTALVVAAAVVGGVIIAWSSLPFAVLVIAAGAGTLAAPLILTNFPDAFVNGRGALIAFAVAATGCTTLLYATT